MSACPAQQDMLCQQRSEMTSNYAFMRSVRSLEMGAAGAWDIVAPAAARTAIPRQVNWRLHD